MKVIYRAFDGTEFDNEASCVKYEDATKRRSVVMMDCNENVVTNTDSAVVVWLKDEESAGIFHKMARENNDEAAANTIPNKKWGFFFWDTCKERYVWIPNDLLNHLTALRGKVLARGEEV